MVSHLLFYQLGVIVFIWLFLLLHLSGPRRASPTAQPPAESVLILPKRHRSTEPQAFAGLTQKPPCPLCAPKRDIVTTPMPIRPDPLPPTNRRPREMDTSMHFCPHEGCAYRGWPGLGNLRANGHPNGGPWRQFHCTSCGGYVLETHGTFFHGKRVAVELMVRVLACLAEGLGIRATARVFEVDAKTVLQWLVEAAEHLRAFCAYCLCNVHVNQVQLDELYAVLRQVQDGSLSEDDAIARLERSPYWVWTAMAPESKLLLVIDVGTRTLEMAQCVVHQVVQVLTPGCVPLFLTDGFKEYGTALLSHFGDWIQPERRQDKGPMPRPRWMPLPELLYAQIVKSYWRRRIVGGKHRIVFGTQLAIEQALATCGWRINTSFVERLNLDIRQRVAAVGRRVNTLGQGEASLLDQLVVFQTSHNFVLPHASLRQPLVEPIPTNGTGSAKVWQPCTPAMAAELTDHVWSLREVLLFRVPPWPQPQTV